MSLKDYLTALQALLDATPFVTATSFSYEERPPSAGLIKGSVLFADGSQLDVKEFLITQPVLSVLKYGYHYRMGTRLIFRYDNANDPAARNLSPSLLINMPRKVYWRPKNPPWSRCCKKSCPT